MIYLDYSASTPIHPKVLDYYMKTSKKYFANPNSDHKLGLEAKQKIEEASQSIQNIFGTIEHEIIYTSGATEANNLAIKGVASKRNHLGKHMITTAFEHGSVISCFNYLAKLGYQVDIVDVDEFGKVSIEHLKSLLREDTILVSIGLINSEIGIIQPLEEVNNVLKLYPNVVFHSDMTQAVGKIKIDVSLVDLASFTSHKFYGLKGIGVLLRKKSVQLEPTIHGGKSSTIYRGGTPSTPLILSFEKALFYAYEDFEENYGHIKMLNEYVSNELTQIDSVILNSCKKCIPHILNFSVIKIDAHILQKNLSDREIYVSTQTACASEQAYSKAVFLLSKDELRAKTSIRISISSLSTLSEMNQFIDAIKEEVAKC